MAAAIRLQNVSKFFRRYPDSSRTTLKTYLLRDCWQNRSRPCEVTRAVQDISLAIERGSTVGIIGRNGSGKSTLLHLIRGVFKPTSGTIWVGGKLSALIELGAGFHPELTGRENILINGIILGLSKAEIRKQFDRIVKFAELEDFIDQPVRTYSTGMYMRLGFSIAAHVNPEILLIDEVLAVGDLPFVRKCHEHLLHFKREGKTMVMVTHDLEMVDRWCDEAIWIDDGHLRVRGEPARVTALYREAVG